MFSEKVYLDAVYLSQAEGYLTGQSVCISPWGFGRLCRCACCVLASAVTFVLCDMVATFEDEVGHVLLARYALQSNCILLRQCRSSSSGGARSLESRCGFGVGAGLAD